MYICYIYVYCIQYCLHLDVVAVWWGEAKETRTTAATTASGEKICIEIKKKETLKHPVFVVWQNTIALF